ncbi:MAG: threonine synthase [Tannerella sp.]|jgi:threonine synthase|nr:threonine synthase [Tannerella sp.]
MRYYSTNLSTPPASLEDVVIKSLASDKGLYMPERIPTLDDAIIKSLKTKSFAEIGDIVAQAYFGDDMPREELSEIVYDTLSFDTPVVQVDDNVFSLELFHGPTLAFKDVGARFMARMLGYFIRRKGLDNEVNVLVATSGDTGGAVANGFLGVEGIRVFVLYPKGKVSPIQECQFTTLGKNITALEIDGTFDDCQALVKAAFADADLNSSMNLTSANSINVARFLPQSFYYFNAYAQLDAIGKADNLIVSVPSGNFGNLTSGLFAWRMGLPVKRFIAANNRNDVFLEYLRSGRYNPRESVETYANAMDVGNPSNFARILDLFGDNHHAISSLIAGFSYADEQIAQIIKAVSSKYAYLVDPHGACGYQALADYGLKSTETGVFLETAHPAKFKETVDLILGGNMAIPPKLAAFMQGSKNSISLSKSFQDFKQYIYELRVES